MVYSAQGKLFIWSFVVISPTLVYDPTASPVARCLINAGAYLIATDHNNWFKWRSGITAPVYTDCRRLNSDAGAMATIRTALGQSLKGNFPKAELVVGIAEAGVVWSSIVALELGLPHAFIRKQVKAHGVSEGRVEGFPLKGAKAVIVDDLVASGDSVQEAIQILRDEAKIETVGIQSIVNWDFHHMRERFRPLNIPLRALVSYPQLLQEAVDQGIIGADARNELVLFYRNPTAHQWNLEALKPQVACKLAC